jgi:hypothetical protein
MSTLSPPFQKNQNKLLFLAYEMPCPETSSNLPLPKSRLTVNGIGKKSTIPPATNHGIKYSHNPPPDPWLWGIFLWQGVIS